MSESLYRDAIAGERPFLQEVYTDTEPVRREAAQRQLPTADSLTLATGFNSTKQEDRDRAWRQAKKPFCLVLAFPCSHWSSLLHLNSNTDVAALRDKSRILVGFAVILAREQLKHKRHFIIENPDTSAAWNEVECMRELVLDNKVFEARFDQCPFGLTSVHGEPHRKRTRIITSSESVAANLDGKFCREHARHCHVMEKQDHDPSWSLPPRSRLCYGRRPDLPGLLRIPKARRQNVCSRWRRLLLSRRQLCAGCFLFFFGFQFGFKLGVGYLPRAR